MSPADSFLVVIVLLPLSAVVGGPPGTQTKNHREAPLWFMPVSTFIALLSFRQQWLFLLQRPQSPMPIVIKENELIAEMEYEVIAVWPSQQTKSFLIPSSSPRTPCCSGPCSRPT